MIERPKSLFKIAGQALLVALVLLYWVAIPVWDWLEPPCFEKRLPYDGPNGLEMHCHPKDLNPRSMYVMFNW